MRLIIMRHGKSDWDSGPGPDHDRPLARRGEKAARTMGKLLTLMDEAPGVILTSSAVRARTTAELAKEGGDWTSQIRVHPELYGTSPDRAIAVARTTPGSPERVMIVGHEPTWSSLVQLLTGARVQVKTATVVGIDVPGARWAELPLRGGEIAYVLQPRNFTTWDLG